MGRPSAFVEIDEVTSFFGKGPSAKMIHRLLERAVKQEMAASRKHMKEAVKATRGGSRLGKAVGGYLAKNLKKALDQRPGGSKGAASIRQKSPQSGGRPFHFKHETVNRASEEGSGAPGRPEHARPKTGASPGGSSNPKPKAGRSGAHMRYIERESAIERGPVAERDAPTLGEGLETGLQAGVDRQREASATPERSDEGWERTIGPSSAAANQAYVEDASKVPQGGAKPYSFGTIGDTEAERIQFWDDLERNEKKKNARVQNRLVLELPHEATPEGRLEIVERFCEQFRERSLPFWAALHRPTQGNDARNFHAHIVYTDRMAKRMLDPTDNIEKWDFAIRESYKTSSRNVRWHNPHRQDRHPDMENIHAISTMRKAFADIVNEVMARQDAKDKDGDPVRYDHRSYKNMGVDVVPAKSINRIISDKAKAGKITILDADYTRRMTQQALQEAAARRDKDLIAFVKLDKAIDELVRRPARAASLNRRLPRNMRVGPHVGLSASLLKAAAKSVMEAKRAALAHQVVTKSGRLALDRIVEATDPKVLGESHARTKDSKRRDALPIPGSTDALHAEAIAMRREFDLEMAAAARTLQRRAGAAINRWSEIVAPQPDATASMKMALDVSQQHIAAQEEARAEAGRPQRREEPTRPKGPSEEEKGGTASPNEDRSKKDPARAAAPPPAPTAADGTPTMPAGAGIGRARARFDATAPFDPLATMLGARILLADAAARSRLSAIKSLPDDARIAALGAMLPPDMRPDRSGPDGGAWMPKSLGRGDRRLLNRDRAEGRDIGAAAPPPASAQAPAPAADKASQPATPMAAEPPSMPTDGAPTKDDAATRKKKKRKALLAKRRALNKGPGR